MQQQLDRERAEGGVEEAAAERADALPAVVVLLGAAAERGVREPPRGVAAEPDGQERHEPPSERLVRDGSERPLVIGRLPARSERELDREDADDRVDHAARDEARAREDGKGRAVDERVARARGRTGKRLRGARDASAIPSAPGRKRVCWRRESCPRGNEPVTASV